MGNQHGLTLLEAMVTLAILAIVLMIGVPSFQQIIEINKAAAVTNLMARSLVLTRSEAVTRNTRVTMCQIKNPNAENLKCDLTNRYAWSHGWIIFVNPNNDNDIKDDEQLLRVVQQNIANVKIERRASVRNRITYTPMGTAGASRFQVTVGAQRRALIINNPGRLRTCNPDRDNSCNWLD